MRIGTFKIITDKRGNLCATNFKDLPFIPKRSFLVYDVPEGMERGEHAHKTTIQALYCLKGSILVCLRGNVNDLSITGENFLIRAGEYTIVDKMIWDSQVFYDNAILQVFCSTEYDENDYIRNFDEFLKLKNKNYD